MDAHRICFHCATTGTQWFPIVLPNPDTHCHHPGPPWEPSGGCPAQRAVGRCCRKRWHRRCGAGVEGKPASAVWKEVLCGWRPWRTEKPGRAELPAEKIFIPLLTPHPPACQALTLTLCPQVPGSGRRPGPQGCEEGSPAVGVNAGGCSSQASHMPACRCN